MTAVAEIGETVKKATAESRYVVYGKQGCSVCDHCAEELAVRFGAEAVGVVHLPDMANPEFACTTDWRNTDATDIMAALADNGMEFPVVRFPDGKIYTCSDPLVASMV